MARDACSREGALARIGAQRPMADKVAVADHVIDNGGSLENTRGQVLSVLRAITAAGP
jgi:dephospho-CoA kinase